MLNTTPVTTASRPTATAPPASGRSAGPAGVSNSPATRQISAAGSSHAIPPIPVPKRRAQPSRVRLPSPPGLVAGEPAETVVAERDSRMLLCCEPPM